MNLQVQSTEPLRKAYAGAADSPRKRVRGSHEDPCTDDVARRAPAGTSDQYWGSCLSCSPFPRGPLPEAWEPLDWLAAFCCRSCISTVQSSNTCLTQFPAQFITPNQGHACVHVQARK